MATQFYREKTEGQPDRLIQADNQHHLTPQEFGQGAGFTEIDAPITPVVAPVAPVVAPPVVEQPIEPVISAEDLETPAVVEETFNREELGSKISETLKYFFNSSPSFLSTILTRFCILF